MQDFWEILQLLVIIFAFIGIGITVKKIHQIIKNRNKLAEPQIKDLQEEDQWRVRKYVHFLFSELVKRGEVQSNIQWEPLPHLDFRREDLLEICESLVDVIEKIKTTTEGNFDFEEIQKAKKAIAEDKALNQKYEKTFETIFQDFGEWDIR